MQKNSILAFQILLIVLVALSSGGCEAIGAIFKAGVWVGVLVVIGVLAVAAALIGLFRRA